MHTKQMEKKMKRILSILFLLSCILFLFTSTLTAEELELPLSGSDSSTLRCPNGVIAIGDSNHDVYDRCGEPLKSGWMPGRTYDIDVYHFPGARFIHYLAYRQNRLERIYSVNCQKGDRLCQ
jgi:hypothetical protein